MPEELPLSIDFNAVANEQRALLRALNGRGLSFEVIAAMFGLDRGASLRSYVVSDRAPRRDNEILKRIHAVLMTEEDTVSGVFSPEAVERYRVRFGSDVDQMSSRKISYPRRIDKHVTPESMFALSEIIHDVFFSIASETLKGVARFDGKHFLFSYDQQSKTVVRSILVIEPRLTPGEFAQFKHYYPDEYWSASQTPSRTHGIIFQLRDTIYFLGNTEGGRAASLMALRDPARDSVEFTVGAFVGGIGRGLSAGKVLVQKQPDADANMCERDYMSGDSCLGIFLRDGNHGFDFALGGSENIVQMISRDS